MQKCAECKQSLKWSQLFKSLWLSFRPVVCHTCGTQHKIANASRLLAVLLLLVPVIVIFIFMQNEALSVISLPIVIVIASISLVLPFILKYEKMDSALDTNNGNL